MALYRMAYDELQSALLGDEREDVGLTLIFENDSLGPMLGPEIEMESSAATPAQRTLYFIQSFVNQTLNGGLGQYLHNCASELQPLLVALDELGWPELGKRLLLTIEELGEEFLQLRDTLWARQGDAKNDTEALQAFLDYLQEVDDDPFNNWFFDALPILTDKLSAMIWRMRAQLVTG